MFNANLLAQQAVRDGHKRQLVLLDYVYVVKRPTTWWTAWWPRPQDITMWNSCGTHVVKRPTT